MPQLRMSTLSPPAHGGNLQQAMDRYGGEPSEWLDLSSAINADAWPIPPIPDTVWHHLPQASRSWPTVCRRYYGSTYPYDGRLCAGSQAVIMALPRTLQPCTVWLLAGSYGEHAYHWQQAGHTVIEWSLPELYQALQQPLAHWPDVLLLVNPDNPSGHRYPMEQLRYWQQGLQARGGWLLLDEAFMDCTPEHSWLQHATDEAADNVIVLRSLGKFFGLAGARLGVVFAGPQLQQALDILLGPWPLTGASQWLVERVLDDRAWQCSQRQRLLVQQQRAQTVFSSWPVLTIHPLFVTLDSAEVLRWHQAFAQQRIWTRVFPQQQRLRLGLPSNELAWQRLQQTLNEIQGL